ncbi:MAG: hypothetical protein AB8B69_10740 [Chitinophagales bacterium]
MSQINFTGKVVYKNIEMGFWGLEANNGAKWLPVNLPTHLQQEGLKVQISGRKVNDFFSMIMWGNPIEITNYKTI